MKDFLKHYIKPKKGNVVDVNGSIIGTHDGAMFFTLGERHGFVINKKTEKDEPYYIVAKNIEKNEIIVSHRSKKEKNNISGRVYNVIKTNWIINQPKENKKYKAQIRYHGEMLSCSISRVCDRKAQIKFDKDVIVDKGQSIVIYDKDTCQGGCIVG